MLHDISGRFRGEATHLTEYPDRAVIARLPVLRPADRLARLVQAAPALMPDPNKNARAPIFPTRCSMRAPAFISGSTSKPFPLRRSVWHQMLNFWRVRITLEQDFLNPAVNITSYDHR